MAEDVFRPNFGAEKESFSSPGSHWLILFTLPCESGLVASTSLLRGYALVHRGTVKIFKDIHKRLKKKDLRDFMLAVRGTLRETLLSSLKEQAHGSGKGKTSGLPPETPETLSESSG